MNLNIGDYIETDLGHGIIIDLVVDIYVILVGKRRAYCHTHFPRVTHTTIRNAILYGKYGPVDP